MVIVIFSTSKKKRSDVTIVYEFVIDKCKNDVALEANSEQKFKTKCTNPELRF